MNIKSFIFPKVYFNETTVSQVDPWTHFDVKKNNPCDNHVYKLNEYFLFENGTVMIYKNNTPIGIKNHNDFCISNFYDPKKTDSSITTAAACFPKQISDEPIEKLNISIPIAMITSIIFLIITFFVYSVLRDLRNIHGKTVMAYSACLCFSYLTIVIVQFGGRKVFDNILLCKINGKYFFLIYIFLF